ncbi:DNA topoisomerase 2-associated protein PAT1 [Kwoniella mangroviensis CBS 8886]|nr:DNA topoisomerase 2-associated protein PAT1 [Kwoniella mangroviensis CBS 8886]
MSGFFGFDTSLPERGGQRGPGGGQQHFSGFQASNVDETFALGGAGEEEDLAVYTWGEGGMGGGGLLEGGDELNDETFGDDLGEINNNFQFSSQPATAPPTVKGKIASTQSRYKPKPVSDPFAFSEDDFYSSRPSKKTTTAKAPSRPKPSTGQSGSVENLWNKPAVSSPAWGTAPSAMTKLTPPPSASFPSQPPAPGHIKSLEEIEAEMAQMAIPSTSTAAPTQQKVFSLEEIEKQMMEQIEPPRQATPQQPAPPREATPTQVPGLAGSGYASQQALLDSMFPELGKGPSALGGLAPAFPPGPRQEGQSQPSQPPQPSPEELARMEELHKRITSKIQSMAKYNNLMGSSDKDFITRIQLSQLATADPYTSDFYAQVFSALKRSRMIAEGQGDGPTVVQVGAGMGLGVGGPVGNRFGKMGQNTMTKLSTQVKKLVENRAQHQKITNTAALQGALGRVTRGNAAAPRPVLAIPTSNKPENRPASQLNQQTGIHRAALTKKQVMFALEELYDAILELEQMRREAPPPTAMEEIEIWHAKCQAKVDIIWRRLMVMEPLDISIPHPFISLVNPIKGQKLFPRLLRHLPHTQSITLLSLLIATYTQLDVVFRAPPPPVADASLLTKADRLDRVKREAETDSFLQFVIPGVDMIINRCGLGLVAGMLAISAQRSEVWRVAATRPGVALYTALLSKAQSLIRSPTPDPMNPQQNQQVDPAELEQWSKTFTYFLHVLLPHLNDLFPSSVAQKAAFGPGAYLIGGDAVSDREGQEMERREAEVWGFVAVLAVNAAEEDQTNLVAALREKILRTVQSSRHPNVSPARAEMKLRNVNMFLNGLGLDASMIE